MDTAQGTDAREASASGAPADGVTPAPHAAEPGPGAGPADPGAARRRRVAVLLAVAVVVYGLDLLTKVLVVAKLANRPPVHVIGTLLELDYTRNPGAAFSIGLGYTIVFTVIAAGVIVVILRLARTLYSLPWAFALGLLLGGALGNLTDRIARSPGLFRGWVVDFIQVPHWPIFNVADSSICVGGVLMVLLAFRGLHPDGTDERLRPAPAAPDHAHATEPRTSDQSDDVNPLDASDQPQLIEAPQPGEAPQLNESTQLHESGEPDASPASGASEPSSGSTASRDSNSSNGSAAR
jgi:signal peptidase II